VADAPISGLTAHTAPLDGPEQLPLVQSGTTKRITVAELIGTIPINSQSAAYSTTLDDAGHGILHPLGDNNARTFTIDGSLSYPIGTTITFFNRVNTVTIAISTDTMYLASAGTTGSRTLAVHGIATATKVASGQWMISGVGLT